MKLLSLIVLFPLLVLAQDVPPPVSLRGNGQTKLLPKWNLVVPSNQATNLGGIDALIETGTFNFLANPSFEGSRVVNDWTVSGSATEAASTANRVFGAQAVALSVTSLNGEAISQSITSTQAIGVETSTIVNLEAWIYANTSSSNFEFCIGTVTSGTFTDSQCVAIPSTAGMAKTPSLFMPYTLSSTTRPAVRVKTTSSTTATINLDAAYLGMPVNIGTVQQATSLGSLTWSSQANCLWTNSGTSATNLTDTDCTTPTVVGSLVAVASGDRPAFNLASAGPGNYRIFVTGMVGIQPTSGTPAGARFRMYDGTDASNTIEVFNDPVSSNNQIYFPGLTFDYTLTTGKSNWTVDLQAWNISANKQVNIDARSSDIRISVYYFPSQAQTIVRADQTDFDWTACPSAAGSWVSNTTYTCKWRRRGSMADFDWNLALSGAPTSTGLTLTLPITIDTTKMSSSVANNTVLEGSTVGIADFGTATYTGAVLYNSTTAVAISAVLVSSTYGTISSQVTQALPFTFGSTDTLNAKFSVPVVGWQENGNAPQLANSLVDSAYAGVGKIHSAKVSSTGFVTGYASSWISGCTNSSGVGTCTFSTAFSAEPDCWFQSNSNSSPGNALVVFDTAATTTSSVSFISRQSTSQASVDFKIFCKGPR